MSLKDQMASDMAIFFNKDEFGEDITYNGATITGIPEHGTDRDRGVGWDSNAEASIATVMVQASDVNSPLPSDEVVIRGKVWTVSRIIASDENTFTLELNADVRPAVGAMRRGI